MIYGQDDRIDYNDQSATPGQLRAADATSLVVFGRDRAIRQVHRPADDLQHADANAVLLAPDNGAGPHEGAASCKLPGRAVLQRQSADFARHMHRLQGRAGSRRHRRTLCRCERHHRVRQPEFRLQVSQDARPAFAGHRHLRARCLPVQADRGAPANRAARLGDRRGSIASSTPRKCRSARQACRLPPQGTG